MRNEVRFWMGTLCQLRTGRARARIHHHCPMQLAVRGGMRGLDRRVASAAAPTPELGDGMHGRIEACFGKLSARGPSAPERRNVSVIGYGSRRRSRWADGAAGASGSGASAGLTANRTRMLKSALYQSGRRCRSRCIRLGESARGAIACVVPSTPTRGLDVSLLHPFASLCLMCLLCF